MDSPRIAARSPSPTRRVVTTYENVTTPGPLPNLTGAARKTSFDSPRSPRSASPRPLLGSPLGGASPRGIRTVSPPPPHGLQRQQQPPPPAYSEAVRPSPSPRYVSPSATPKLDNQPPPPTNQSQSGSPPKPVVSAAAPYTYNGEEIPPHMQNTMARMAGEIQKLQEWKHRWDGVARAFDSQDHNLSPVVREHIYMLEQQVTRQREMLTNEMNAKTALQKTIEELQDRLRVQAEVHKVMQSPRADPAELVALRQKVDALDVELFDAKAEFTNKESQLTDKIESLEKDLSTAKRKEKQLVAQQVRKLKQMGNQLSGSNTANLQNQIECLQIDLMDKEVERSNLEAEMQDKVSALERAVAQAARKKQLEMEADVRRLKLDKNIVDRDLNRLSTAYALLAEEKDAMEEEMEAMGKELRHLRQRVQPPRDIQIAYDNLTVELYDEKAQKEALQAKYEAEVEELQTTIRKSALKEKAGRKRAMTSRVQFQEKKPSSTQPDQAAVDLLTVELCDERERRDALERAMEEKMEQLHKEQSANNRRELAGRRRAQSMRVDLNKQVDKLSSEVDRLRGELGSGKHSKKGARLQRMDVSSVSAVLARGKAQCKAARLPAVVTASAKQAPLPPPQPAVTTTTTTTATATTAPTNPPTATTTTTGIGGVSIPRVERIDRLNSPRVAGEQTVLVTVKRATNIFDEMQGTYDLYTVLRLEGGQASCCQTNMVSNSKNPEWNENFEIVVSASSVLVAELYVKLPQLSIDVSNRHLLGSGRITISQTILRGINTTMIIPVAKQGCLFISFNNTVHTPRMVSPRGSSPSRPSSHPTATPSTQYATELSSAPPPASPVPVPSSPPQPEGPVVVEPTKKVSSLVARWEQQPQQEEQRVPARTPPPKSGGGVEHVKQVADLGRVQLASPDNRDRASSLSGLFLLEGAGDGGAPNKQQGPPQGEAF